MENTHNVYRIFGGKLKEIIKTLPQERLAQINEIRIRAERPVLLHDGVGECFLSPAQGLTEKPEEGYIATLQDVSACMNIISEHSLYAFEEEIKKGFITIAGGHRIGLCGRAVTEQGKIKTLRSITALNVRVARQLRGCGDAVIPYLVEGDQVRHTMVISPPGCGKTTLLRDIVRQLSDGVVALNFPGMAVAVIDERSEIAASYMGIPQNDVGMRTDVLDCGPKAEGMRLMLRSMSPRVIAVDEIGSTHDADAIEELANAGVKLICTAHGRDVEDIKKNPALRRILDNRRMERVIALSNRRQVGGIEAIYDGDLRAIPFKEGEGGMRE